MTAPPDGWLADDEAAELTRLAAGLTVLELGSYKGRATVALAASALRVVTIDRHRTWTVAGVEYADDSLRELRQAVADLQNVTVVVGDFAAAELLDADAFDLVFVDGVHDEASVRADLAVAARFRRATLVLHDWGRYDVTAVATSLGLVPRRIVGSVAVL